MPNGGLTPDCVHCQHYSGQPISDGKPFCQHHQINLPSPIRAFCKEYVDPQPIDGEDWLDIELNRDELRYDLMYLWLGGYEIKFFHVELAPIKEYSTWTLDIFLEQVKILSDQHSGE